MDNVFSKARTIGDVSFCELLAAILLPLHLFALTCGCSYS